LLTLNAYAEIQKLGMHRLNLHNDPIFYIKTIKNQVVFIMALPIQGKYVLLEHFSDAVYVEDQSQSFI
jgi:hypothetical protein